MRIKFAWKINFTLLLSTLFCFTVGFDIDNNCICRNENSFEVLLDTNVDGQKEIANGNSTAPGCNQSTVLAINVVPAHCDAHTTLARLTNPQLKQLDWHHTGLRELINYTLAGVPHVHQLNLSANMIVSIDSDAFKHLLALTVLDLSHNRIESLPVNVLLANTMLTHIWFAGNRLTVLEMSLGTRALLALDISGNQLVSVELRAPGVAQKRVGNGWQRNHNNLSINLDYNQLNELLLSPAFQTNHVSMRHNALQDLQLFSKVKPLSMESLDLEHNRLGFATNKILDLAPMAYTSKLKRLYLANNELEVVDVTSLASHFPKLRFISLHQRWPWLCTELYRTLDALRLKEIHVVDVATDDISSDCFEPRNAFRALQQQYTTLLLAFLTSTAFLLTAIALLALTMRRSLRRMRADSISKSFDIKLMPPPLTQPTAPLPPLPPAVENIYEENVYNHVYSDPTPTTTL